MEDYTIIEYIVDYKIYLYRPDVIVVFVDLRETLILSDTARQAGNVRVLARLSDNDRFYFGSSFGARSVCIIICILSL